MTNAQCLSEEENPKVEDMAVGMIIAKWDLISISKLMLKVMCQFIIR